MVAGTTPVTTLREPSIVFAGTQTKTQLHLDTLTKTDGFALHQFGAIYGEDIFVFRFKSVVSN